MSQDIEDRTAKNMTSGTEQARQDGWDRTGQDSHDMWDMPARTDHLEQVSQDRSAGTGHPG
jgi:hypothetical protein